MTETGAVAEASLPAATAAGMYALWNPSRFTGITSYEAWENALLDDSDIAGYVRAGELVPINIGGDGAFQFLVRVGMTGQAPVLTRREQQHLLVSSQAYLYHSSGRAFLTGIEDICADPGPGIPALTVPAGPHAVTIHLIDWTAEPGAQDARGKPTPVALPDFLVLIGPEGVAGSSYRTNLQTFDRD